jgi:hypothetical protein
MALNGPIENVDIILLSWISQLVGHAHFEERGQGFTVLRLGDFPAPESTVWFVSCCSRIFQSGFSGFPPSSKTLSVKDGQPKPENVQQNLVDTIFCYKLPIVTSC